MRRKWPRLKPSVGTILMVERRQPLLFKQCAGVFGRYRAAQIVLATTWSRKRAKG